jgi:hypothetical protein
MRNELAAFLLQLCECALGRCTVGILDVGFDAVVERGTQSAFHCITVTPYENLTVVGRFVIIFTDEDVGVPFRTSAHARPHLELRGALFVGLSEFVIAIPNCTADGAITAVVTAALHFHVNAIELEMVIKNLHAGIGLVLDAFDALGEKTDNCAVARIALAHARLPANRVNGTVSRGGFVEVRDGVDVKVEKIGILGILGSHGDYSLDIIGLTRFYFGFTCCFGDFVVADHQQLSKY